MRINIGLALLIISTPLMGTEDDNLDPHPQVIRTKPAPWQASVFVGGAFLFALAGIVIICLDGGTSKAATAALDSNTTNKCEDFK
jgi:hypothetical protein